MQSKSISSNEISSESAPFDCNRRINFWKNGVWKLSKVKRKDIENFACLPDLLRSNSYRKIGTNHDWWRDILTKVSFLESWVLYIFSTRSISKWSLTGLNSEFSFLTSCLTKAEEHSLPYYLPIAGGRIIGFIPFPRGISAMWISLIEDLNSCRCVHFLRR